MCHTSKRKKKIMPILFLLIMGAALLSGCGYAHKEEEAGETMDAGRLISFYYSYTDFRYRPFIYTIERKADGQEREGVFFKAEGYSDGLISLEEEIEEAVLDDIVRIMEEENIFAWDGFRQYNTEIRDGFSFDMKAEFVNRAVTASGYMEEPENFKAGHQRLSEYLLKLAQSFGED